MDADTTRAQGKHEEILRAFSEGDAGLLLGTQVVAKGHDFEHVTLVGVVNADPALFQPDFRSEERTFRLLVQAAGRAGRGARHGEVIIQTLDPDHPAFDALMAPDIESFSTRQLSQREELGYPPFSRMIAWTLTAPDDQRAAQAAREVVKRCREIQPMLDVRGPVPTFVARVKRRYRYRILLSTSRRSDPSGEQLRNAVRKVLSGLKLTGGVESVMDVDPLEVT
jgi:primosomal protein N' (replication factor Y)